MNYRNFMVTIILSSNTSTTNTLVDASLKINPLTGSKLVPFFNNNNFIELIIEGQNRNEDTIFTSLDDRE